MVFVDTSYGSTFHIESDLNDNVLDIKNKIEKSQGIPVSMQILYHNGEPLLIDYLDLITYNIDANSRLFLALLDLDNNNQVLQPTTEQSLATSATSFQDSFGEFQDWSAAARSNNRDQMVQEHYKNQDLVHKDPSSTSNAFGDLMFSEETEQFSNTKSFGSSNTTEESSIDNSNVFHKEQSTMPSSTFGGLFFDEDLPLTTEHFSNNQPYVPARTTEESVDVFDTEQSTIPSSTFGGLFFDEDIPLTTEHFTQRYIPESTAEENSNMFDTEQSTIDDTFINKQAPVPSTEQRINAQKEVINVTDSPVKVKSRSRRRPPQRLRVMILPYSSENEPVSKVPVSVMTNENVEELRKKLEMMREKGELKLPQEGYFFIHKQNVLDDDKTFLWNGVAHGDTIDVFPGYVTKEGRTYGL